MTASKRVAVFTGTRAEYGLLAPLLRLITQHDELELHLIVSGTHLSHLHGYTIDHIRADGFVPNAELESILASDTAQSVNKALALTILDVGAELDRSDCAFLVVLGDRFEAFGAATAAVVHGVPVAHLHGGEASEGATDERFRHAITKLADLHFVAGPEFAGRVLQMGEPRDRVFECGPAVQDVLATLTTVDRRGLEEALGVALERPTALLVYHPATAADEDPGASINAILDGVLSAGVGLVLVSLPNADERSSEITRIIGSRAQADERIAPLNSVGQNLYLSLLREVDLIVGNSSSGIIEAPLLGTPTVNVGTRQQGRPRASSVVDVSAESESVGVGCRQALDADWLASRSIDSPYRAGASMAELVVNVLAATDASSLRSKQFSNVTNS